LRKQIPKKKHVQNEPAESLEQGTMLPTNYLDVLLDVYFSVYIWLSFWVKIFVYMDAHQMFDEICEWKVSYVCITSDIWSWTVYMCIITSDIWIWLNRANHIKHTENETIDI
jgi:hypothetical protein